ncbi:MAG: hypothetical protein L3J79_10540, partial [Candidatus Marinimicrobia bacterium]|nr:hypothetical protein [Candidatus Neomarinimicrobiota bacterium]
VFDRVAIDVLTESKKNGSVVSNPYHEDFAAHIRDNWDAYADANPKLRQVERLARIVAIVKWLKDSGLPLDLGYLQGYAPESVVTEAGVKPETVSDSWTKRRTTVSGNTTTVTTTIYTMTITGGVSYSTPNELLPDTTEGDSLRDQALASRSEDTDLEWNFGSGTRANAFSICKEAQGGSLAFGQTDLSFPVKGGNSISFSRYYSSFLEEDVESLGKGWMYSGIRLRFPSSKKNYTATRENGSTLTGAWYPDIIAVNNSIGFQIRYILYGVNAQDEPIYRSDRKAAGRIDTLVLEQKTSTTDEFRLADPATQFEYLWTSAGLAKQETDAVGNVVTYDYADGEDTLPSTLDDQLIKISSGVGAGLREIHVVYGTGLGSDRIDHVEGPGSVGDGDNIKVNFDYDGDNRLVDVTHPFNPRLTFFYAENGSGHMLSAFKSVDGVNTEIFKNENYDVYGRAASTTSYPNSANSMKVDKTFDVNKGEEASTDELGGSQAQKVDELKRPLEMTDVDGDKVTLTYTNEFGPSTITNRRGNASSYSYNDRGVVTGVIDPMGRSSSVVYYPGSENVFISYVTTAGGNTEGMVAFEYEDDKIKRVFHKASGLSLDESTGSFSVSIDPQLVSEYFYTDGDLVSVIDAEGRTVSVQRNNEIGLVDTVVSATGLTSTIEAFDTLSRPQKVRSA